MAVPASFQSLTSSVLPSQEREVLIAKQAALGNYSHQTRSALGKLPSPAVDALLAEYKAPSGQTMDSVFLAIAQRERIIESAEKGQNLDVEWLNQGNSTRRHMDEVGLGADDSWNEGRPSV